MSKIELVFTDEEIDRFAEKVASKLNGVNEERLDEGCLVCSSDYHQEIVSVLIRYHTSEATSGVIETRFCPNCGRQLNT